VNLEVDVVIFGGGCAGLWLLDDLRRRGARVVLLEAAQLGGGQTTASQGILHGGVKYLLSGLRSASASSIRDMPARWRASLSGAMEPDLSSTRLRSRSCYLWRSDSWQSWAGLLGARTMLEVKPVPLLPTEIPDVLAKCPGQVFRLDEEVIDTVCFSQVLATRNQGLILKIDAQSGLDFKLDTAGAVQSVTIRDSQLSRELTFHPGHVVLAAGAGNTQLRQRVELSASATQTRPLHMVLVRGDLPELNGHCVDGAKTRVTITSDVDASRRTVWQVGGQIAEDGVKLEPLELMRHARRELSAVLPGWKPDALEWSTYRIDRAERRTADGSRPDDVQLIHESNVFTIWPTKLVLAPRMSERVQEELEAFQGGQQAEFRKSLMELNWPQPAVALPPWERQTTWISDV
jgi:glycerol-3-phosphate dehydrogenase